jgi:hypothetical protein
MTTTTDEVRSKAPQNHKDDAYNYALQSVYYHSLGSELESRGAPVMVVPPEVRPLPLDEALDELKDNLGLLWSAYWRIVRSVPVEGWERPLVRRYPPAFVDAMAKLGNDKLARLDEFRRHGRARAHFLTAALLAAVERPQAEVEPLRQLLEEALSGEDKDIVEALVNGMGTALGSTGTEFVDSLASQDGQDRARQDLTKLQSEVGLNLSDFTEDFLDTVAFQCFKGECELPDDVVKAVLTSSCIVRQDTNTMTTTATVTTLAPGATLDALRHMIDPLHWPDNSRVIRETKYVNGSFDLNEPDYGTDDPTFLEPRFLYEDVHVGWGLDNVQRGGFRNVLAVDYFKANEETGISLPFRLCRSIDSRVMWDSRPGGILIDGGYLVARPVGEGSWRVTTRKVLQFSDRAPNSKPAGGMDYGQMINYLAPAAVTLWLETDFYESMGESKDRAGKTEKGARDG